MYSPSDLVVISNAVSQHSSGMAKATFIEMIQHRELTGRWPDVRSLRRRLETGHTVDPEVFWETMDELVENGLAHLMYVGDDAIGVGKDDKGKSVVKRKKADARDETSMVVMPRGVLHLVSGLLAAQGLPPLIRWFGDGA